MESYKETVEKVRARINSTLKEKGITQNQVAAGDSAAQKRINSQLSHGASISLDTILRILKFCPDISSEWLLRGIGEKYKVINSDLDNFNSITSNTNIKEGTLSENFVYKLIAEKDEQIRRLIEKIGEKKQFL